MYKVEFFDTNLQYKSSSMFQVEELTLDYLTLDPTVITVVGNINVKKGFLAHITGTNTFDGVVSDVVVNKNTMDVAVRPLQAIFDIEVLTSQTNDIASFLHQSIYNNLSNNIDVLQNIPLNLVNKAQSALRPYAFESYKINLVEVMSIAITTYKIVINCKLDMKNKVVLAEIEEINHPVTIEADLDNVLDKEITLGDSYGSLNKVIIQEIQKEQEIMNVLSNTSFFLHTDGSISNINQNRISPVFYVYEQLETSETFLQEAQLKAEEVLTPQLFDNEINLTYLTKDNITHPDTLPIGTLAKIYIKNNVYSSILTGKVFKDFSIKLIFGVVRVDLTKKLIIERRKKNVNNA